MYCVCANERVSLWVGEARTLNSAKSEEYEKLGEARTLKVKSTINLTCSIRPWSAAYQNDRKGIYMIKHVHSQLMLHYFLIIVLS